MAIDFYAVNKSGEKELVLQMDDREFDHFSAVNDALKRATGIFIDPYGRTRVCGGHLRILLDAIAEQSGQGGFRTRRSQELARQFAAQLEIAHSQQNTLLVEGE